MVFDEASTAHGGPAQRGPVWRYACAHPALVALLVFAVFAALFFSGIGARDTHNYVLRALAFLGSPASMFGDHWGMRWPIILPTAASLAIFGGGELQANLPQLLAAPMVVLIGVKTVQRVFGREAALLCGLLLATSPFHAFAALDIRISTIEAMFIASCLYLLVRGFETGRWTWYFWAGLCGAGAWFSRETGAFLFPLLMLAGLASPVAPMRRLQNALAAGGAMVGAILVEWLCYWIVMGDPFYRIVKSMNHGRGQEGTQMAVVPAAPDATRFLLKPITDLITDGMVFASLASLLVAIAIIAVARVKIVWKPVQLYLVALLVIGSAGSFVYSAYILSLEIPEYYPIVPFAVTLLGGSAMAIALRPVPAAIRLMLVAVPLLANAVLVDLRPSEKMEDTRFLALHSSGLAYPVWTDEKTQKRAQVQKWLGVGSGLCPAVPASHRGSLIYLRQEGPGLGIAVDPSWQLVGTARVQRRSPGLVRLFNALGFENISAALSPKTTPAPKLYLASDTDMSGTMGLYPVCSNP